MANLQSIEIDGVTYALQAPDSALSSTSTNAVENRAIKAAFDDVETNVSALQTDLQALQTAVDGVQTTLDGYAPIVIGVGDAESTDEKYVLAKDKAIVYPAGGFYDSNDELLVPWTTPTSIDGYNNPPVSQFYIQVDSNGVWEYWDGPTSNMGYFKTISVPDGITGITSSFRDNSHLILEELYIPESVTTMPSNLFANFTKPLTVYYRGTATGWERSNITVVTR